MGVERKLGFFRNSVTSYDVSLKETRERISNDMHVLVQFTLRFRALLVVISQKETHHKTSGGAVASCRFHGRGLIGRVMSADIDPCMWSFAKTD